jgi:hypothetical protein
MIKTATQAGTENLTLPRQGCHQACAGDLPHLGSFEQGLTASRVCSIDFASGSVAWVGYQIALQVVFSPLLRHGKAR